MRGICLVLFAAVMLSAQKAPSLEDLNTKLDKILKILEEADAPPPPLKVDISGMPVLGDRLAPVTVVEFTDMQCPYCAKFTTDIFPALYDQYIATGKIRFVSRDLPLSMHKNAMQAAEARRCAAEQEPEDSHFWEMRDWMHRHPDKLEIEGLRAHAIDLNLDLEQYRSCMATGKYRKQIELDAKEAQGMNINGTPAFIVGKSLAGQTTIEGSLITGAQPLTVFESAILKAKDSIAK